MLEKKDIVAVTFDLRKGGCFKSYFKITQIIFGKFEFKNKISCKTKQLKCEQIFIFKIYI